MKAVVTAQPQNQDKVVVEMVSDGASALMEADVWPFEGLCAVLCNELFEYVKRLPRPHALLLLLLTDLHQAHVGRFAMELLSAFEKCCESMPMALVRALAPCQIDRQSKTADGSRIARSDCCASLPSIALVTMSAIKW